MAYTQANRRIQVETPLGGDELLLASFTGREAVSTLFDFHLELLSENPGIELGALVGKGVTVKILLADGERVLHGLVRRFAQKDAEGGFYRYEARLVPWLWMLTRTRDCRIFQEKSVPEIVEAIFKDLGFSDYSLRLQGTYAPRTYCVQYRETDFDFVSRLLEEEGIHYFFEHETGKHTLVLADAAAENKPCPGQATARLDRVAGGWREDDVVQEIAREESVRPGKVALADYNFETPSTSLAVNLAGENGDFEVYDYPGEYGTRDEGDRYAKARLEEEEAPRVFLQGTSRCRAFAAGFRFELKEHFRGDLNGTYLITSVEHRVSQGGDYTGRPLEANDGDFEYANRFEAIPYAVPFRPSRTTAKPLMRGCQTAVVVGPSGEEICVDKYGRIKVQFHWDREGKKDENSSCWVRVAQPWAGKTWGAFFLPRMGQEVVVDFLEGDPDQPIVVGSVYNAEQMPPYELPADQTKSTIKTRSAKGGTPDNFNEIRFEDKKGSEELYIHAEKNQTFVVENDRSKSVGNDESTSVGNNRTETVGNDETISITANRTETVGGNQKESVTGSETLAVTGSRTRTVGGAESVTVSGARTHTVVVNEAITIGGAREVTVAGAQALTVGGAHAVTVGGGQSTTVGGGRTVAVAGPQGVTVGADLTEKVAGNHQVDIDKGHAIAVKLNYGLKAKKIVIEAEEEVIVKTGSAKIAMKKNGDIEIDGKNIVIKASAELKLKGSKVLAN